MSNYGTLIASIQSVITQNGNNEITGTILQQTLLSMINYLGSGYQFIGVATPETNPGTPDQRVFYLASSGTYPNFGPAIIPTGNLAVLYYDTSWHYSFCEITAKFASGEEVNQVHIVKDLSTGGSSNVTNAEIVKTLAELVIGDNIDISLNKDITDKDGYIVRNNSALNNSGSYTTTAGNVLRIIPVAPGDKITIDVETTCFCGIVKEYYPLTYCASYNGRFNANKNATTPMSFPITMPNDANYVIVTTNRKTSTDPAGGVPTNVKVYQVAEYDKSLDERVSELEEQSANALTDSDIADNLTTNDATKVLSAKQGKKINDQLNVGYDTDVRTDGTLYTSKYTKIESSASIGDTVSNTLISSDDTWETIRLQVQTGDVVVWSVYNKDDWTHNYAGAAFVGSDSKLKWKLGYVADNVVYDDSSVVSTFTPTVNTVYSGQYTALTNGTFVINSKVVQHSDNHVYYISVVHRDSIESRLGEVEDDVEVIKSQLGDTSIAQITSRLWNGYVKSESASINNEGTVYLSNYPIGNKKGDKICFSAKITSWNGGIKIGKGTSTFGGQSNGYLLIDGTNISGNAGTEISATPHSLTFSDFVNITIDIAATSWTIIIQTKSGTYKNTFDNQRYNSGSVRVVSTGAVLTEAVLSCTNNYYASPIWMFGDSYFGIGTSNREMFWLEEWGYLHCLVNGIAGRASAAAISDMGKCLAIGKPRYVVWALGMNDNIAGTAGLNAWIADVESVKATCEEIGAELVLVTIPKPYASSYVNKDEMSAWIRSDSGCRYIDVAKAVGCNSNGEWYNNGQDNDYQESGDTRVHPSVYGAKAIATQFLIDFPEIMQY